MTKKFRTETNCNNPKLILGTRNFCVNVLIKFVLNGLLTFKMSNSLIVLKKILGYTNVRENNGNVPFFKICKYNANITFECSLNVPKT